METPFDPPASAIRFRVRLRTRWSDEDVQGVLNNAVYLTLLEEARFAYFSSLGLLEENRFPFVLAQANVLFVAPGRGGAEVEVELVDVRLGTSSLTQAYRIRDVASGKLLCEAEARLVAHDPATGAARPMSPAFRAAIERRERGG